MNARSTLFLVISICLMSFPAIAGDYEDAINAHDTKDYKTAFSIFTKLADEGHSGAQFYLGHMYRHSESVKASKKKTAKWIQKAAAQGNDDARVTLGMLHKFGEGVSKSQEKAFALYKLASDNGHIAGRYNLAGMYRWGFGVEEDSQEAFDLYSQVKRTGGINSHLFYTEDSDAGYEINRMKEKYGWLKETLTAKQVAAKKIEKENKAEQQRIYAAKETALFKAEALAVETVEEGLLAYQAKNYKRAFPILYAHGNNGNVDAQTKVGIMYRDGLGALQDDQSAGIWFQKAEAGGSGEAYYHHARLRSSGRYYGSNLLPDQLMEKSYYLGYQPAIDDFNRAQEQEKIRVLAQDNVPVDTPQAYVPKSCVAVTSVEKTHSGSIVSQGYKCY